MSGGIFARVVEHRGTLSLGNCRAPAGDGDVTASRSMRDGGRSVYSLRLPLTKSTKSGNPRHGVLRFQPETALRIALLYARAETAPAPTGWNRDARTDAQCLRDLADALDGGSAS